MDRKMTSLLYLYNGETLELKDSAPDISACEFETQVTNGTVVNDGDLVVGADECNGSEEADIQDDYALSNNDLFDLYDHQHRYHTQQQIRDTSPDVSVCGNSQNKEKNEAIVIQDSGITFLVREFESADDVVIVNQRIIVEEHNAIRAWHLMNKHHQQKQQQQEQQQFTCQYCKEQFSYYLSEKHKKVCGPFRCEPCNIRFPYESKLLTHEESKNHKRNIGIVTPKFEYPCKVCGRLFKREKVYWSHPCVKFKDLLERGNSSPSSSPPTKKTFGPLPSSLPSTTTSCTPPISSKIECEFCHRSFNGQSFLLHVCYDKITKTYHCTRCGEKLLSRVTYQLHICDEGKAKRYHHQKPKNHHQSHSRENLSGTSSLDDEHIEDSRETITVEDNDSTILMRESGEQEEQHKASQWHEKTQRLMQKTACKICGKMLQSGKRYRKHMMVCTMLEKNRKEKLTLVEGKDDTGHELGGPSCENDHYNGSREVIVTQDNDNCFEA